MDSLIVYTSEAVSDNDLRSFVTERGGYWNDDATVDEGVIEQGSGTLYIAANPAFENELAAGEVAALTERLGRPPAGSISIHIGGPDRPYTLATRIAREMADRWRGYIYKQDGKLNRSAP